MEEENVVEEIQEDIEENIESENDEESPLKNLPQKPLGYLYLAETKSFSQIKIGSTLNISRRKWDYYTYIPDGVTYYVYFEILSPGRFGDMSSPILSIEKSIHKDPWFLKRKYMNREEYYITGGEYDTDIKEYMNNIKYILRNYGILFRVKTEDTFLTRPERSVCKKRENVGEDNIQGEMKNEYTTDYIQDYIPNYIGDDYNDIEYIHRTKIETFSESLKLRDYQEKCIEIMGKKTIGKFVLPTGSGKTVIFLSYLSGLKKSLVLVPFLNLIEQTVTFAKHFNFGEIFKICEGVKELVWKGKGDGVLYVSTYQSSNKVRYDFLKEKFDCIIFDECHMTVLCEENEGSPFQYMLKNGKTFQKFFFTATEKNVRVTEGSEEGEETEKVISMDNEEIYGKTLYKLHLDEAISREILCDYNINIWFHGGGMYDRLNCLGRVIFGESLGKKIVVFCKNIKVIREVVEHLRISLSDTRGIFISGLYGEISYREQGKILNGFKRHKGISVLVVCKMFKVGVDIPSIDTIIHYNRCESSIDFIQKNGRALRRYEGKNESSIVIMTEYGEGDRDIRYYRKLIENIGVYDRRVGKRMKYAREYVSNGIDMGIEVRGDVLEGEYLEVYDRYMNYIGGNMNVIEKVKLLCEFVWKNGRKPKRGGGGNKGEIYRGVNLGSSYSNLYINYLKPIRNGKMSLYPKNKSIKITNILRDTNTFDLKRGIDKFIEKEIPKKLILLIDFCDINDTIPQKSGELYKNEDIGRYYKRFYYGFIIPIKNGNKPTYHNNKSDIILLFLKMRCYFDIENNINKFYELSLKNKPQYKIYLLAEYLHNHFSRPPWNYEYKGQKIGNFDKSFRLYFVIPIMNGEPPIRYKKEKDYALNLFEEYGLYNPITNKFKYY